MSAYERVSCDSGMRRRQVSWSVATQPLCATLVRASEGVSVERLSGRNVQLASNVLNAAGHAAQAWEETGSGERVPASQLHESGMQRLR